MADFCNPGLLDDYSTFRKVFENPILKSRAPGCSAKEAEIGAARHAQVNVLPICYLENVTHLNLSLSFRPSHVVSCCVVRLLYSRTICLLNVSSPSTYRRPLSSCPYFVIQMNMLSSSLLQRYKRRCSSRSFNPRH